MPRNRKQIFFISDNGRNVTLVWKRDSKKGKAEGKSNNKEKKILTDVSEESSQ